MRQQKTKMTPFPTHEPPKYIETKAFLKAPKFSFQLEHIELPMGVQGTFGIIRHPGASLAVPITSSGEIILLRQYRFAVEQRILEFPAGTLENGEAPLTAMKRELGEETGYIASKWRSLGEMLPCPGYSNEVIHMFLAEDLKALQKRPPGDADEDITVIQIPPKELDALIASGEERLDGKSVTAWFRAKQLLELVT